MPFEYLSSAWLQMLDLYTTTASYIVGLMFNPVLSNRKQDLESHNKSGNEDSGEMSEEEEEEEEEVGSEQTSRL